MKFSAKVLVLALFAALSLSACGDPDGPPLEVVEQSIRDAHQRSYDFLGYTMTVVKANNLECKKTKDKEIKAWSCRFEQEIHYDNPDWNDKTKVKKEVKKQQAGAMFTYREGKWIRLF